MNPVPAFSTIVLGAVPVNNNCKLIAAFGAVIDFGAYPICFARATTLSLKVDESKNSSLTTMLALNAV